jgi:F-type H+-transporting ATPase subunit b
MDIQLPQIIFQIINFSVVLGALTYLLYKPVLKVLDERAKRVAESQEAAQKAIAEGEKLEELKKSTKQKAEKDAAKFLEDASVSAKERKSQLLAQAKEEALQEVERLRQAWNDEKRASVQAMKTEFSQAVIATAQKVIGASVDAKAQSKLIDQEFNNLLKTL